MTTNDKKQTLLALRKCVHLLEAELGEDEALALAKRNRKNPVMQSFENRYELGIRERPRLNTKVKSNAKSQIQ